jgi:hypothetical protein
MGRGPIEVVFNAGTSEITLPIARTYETVLASSPEIVCKGEELRLPAGSVVILRDPEARFAS